MHVFQVSAVEGALPAVRLARALANSRPLALNVDVVGWSRTTEAAPCRELQDSTEGEGIGKRLQGMTIMFVSQLLAEARMRLKTIAAEALLMDAAKALSIPHTEVVVVCDADGKAVGVITKADIVRRITHCEGAACRAVASAAMTREMVSCRPEDPLADVWSKMKQHGLRHIPVVDAQSRPVGIINARDALHVLLNNEAQEAQLLRDYVMSMGYH